MMPSRGLRYAVVFLTAVWGCLGCGVDRRSVYAAAPREITAAEVLRSIERGREFLVRSQNADGSFSATRGGEGYRIGITSLALLALINSGLTADDEPIQRGLKFLRSLRDPEPNKTYEIALTIMALSAANDGDRDRIRISHLARRLERGQVRGGPNAGLWTYYVTDELIDTGGDRSNGQFAVLGLREAAYAGYQVDRQTWERARRHWLTHQNGDGGWSYTGRAGAGPSTGSMTVAGIATLVITSEFLRSDKEVDRQGKPICCDEAPEDQALARAIAWLSDRRRFAVGHNPGSRVWLLYYLYGLERAGRLSGRRFFGPFDWYRMGARYLVDQQSRRWGGWQGVGGLEQDPVVGTSLALLFLSKGLAPVLINKLKYGLRDPANADRTVDGDWNRHPNDVRRLTQHITGLKRWPKLLNVQVVDFDKVAAGGGVTELLQAPVLFISGRDRPAFLDDDRKIALLREFIEQGGFLFAVNSCGGAGFHDGIEELVQRLYPNGEARLERLPPSHDIFRAEYPLDGEFIELYGVDFGCRTAIVYAPDDYACLWDKWLPYDPPKRDPRLTPQLQKAMRIGVNVIAYATGREAPNKLETPELLADDTTDQIERGLLQIAKLRHEGGWDTAPQALRHLLVALNRKVGLAASTKKHDLPATDSDIFNYPLLYMHGRNRFEFSERERNQLKTYLQRGGVLFADASCGSTKFDASFRTLMKQMFPDRPLVRIPADHELFTQRIGFDIREVSRRSPEIDEANVALKTVTRRGEPFLEGIEIDGRFAVIYSKYDIGCALQRQSAVGCAGYVPDDALKIAINVVLYAMLQDVRYADLIR